MQQIEKQLTELESKSQSTASKLAHLVHQQQRRSLLLLINNPSKLSSALTWIQSHHLSFSDITVVVKIDELVAPIVVQSSDLTAVPPFLQPITTQIFSSLNPVAVALHALPPLELTTTTVALLHHHIDLVFIVGCQCLSRGEYENVVEFKPLVEEILLKEAIQPVILFK